MSAPYDFYNYQKYWQSREYEDKAEKLTLSRFFSRIPQRDSIIDIGGGFGRLVEVYLHLFKKCLLIDPSEKLLKIAQKKFKKHHHLEFKKGVGERLPVKSKTYDVALMIRITHHVLDPFVVFREASRVLKPEGFLILEFANKIHFVARARSVIQGNFGFVNDFSSVNQSSKEDPSQKTYPFLNHHPEFIYQKLEKAGFKVIDKLSVSNFRHPVFKKILPPRFLLFLESVFQKPLAASYFGPSIFLLCQKI